MGGINDHMKGGITPEMTRRFRKFADGIGLAAT